jgi:hypothetical protein
MGSLKFKDQLLAPERKIVISYKGKNPFKPCPMARQLLKYRMKISSKDIWEDESRWDVTGDPRDFYHVIRARREMDNWSYIYIRLRIQGAQHSTDRTGWVKIWLEGWVETKFDYSNFIQRSLWLLFNYLFYYKQRRKYLDFGKDMIYQIRQDLMEALGIWKGE